MAYHVVTEVSAAKQIIKIGDREAQTRIVRKIKSLEEDPRPAGCTKLSGMSDSYRIRVGDYRIVYTVADSIRVVTVTRVGHRREVYD